MKPSAPGTKSAAAGKSGPFAFLERYLSAPAPNDPLYLTNQTFGQRFRRMLVFGVPVLVVVAVIVVGILMFGPKSKEEKALTPAEVANKILPNFDSNIKLDSNPDLEVIEVHFDYSNGSFMCGNLKNRSNHPIGQAVIVFDLADADRSTLGGVTVKEANLPPGEVRAFRLPIEQKGAASAVVREVHTQ